MYRKLFFPVPFLLSACGTDDSDVLYECETEHDEIEACACAAGASNHGAECCNDDCADTPELEDCSDVCKEA